MSENCLSRHTKGFRKQYCDSGKFNTFESKLNIFRYSHFFVQNASIFILIGIVEVLWIVQETRFTHFGSILNFLTVFVEMISPMRQEYIIVHAISAISQYWNVTEDRNNRFTNCIGCYDEIRQNMWFQCGTDLQ